MLHIEMYTGEVVGSLTDDKTKYEDMLYAKSNNFSEGRSFQRRKDFFDLIDLLELAYINSKKEGLL